MLGGGVGDRQTAAHVVHGEFAERRDRPDGRTKRLQLEQLRADVEMQTDKIQVRDTRKPIDRRARLEHGEAELGIGLACRDRLVGLPRDVRGHPDQDLLTAAELHGDSLQLLELVEGIEHDVTDARLERRAQLARGLGIAVEVDSRGVEATPQRQRQLSTRGDVACQSLLRQDSVDGGAWKCL